MTIPTYAPPMPLFVVVYDRRRAQTRELLRFDAERSEVALSEWRRREHAELGNPDIEVVLFEAESEEDLRRTHARYFDLGEEIARREL